jgi:hypothetical protein
MLDGRAGPGGAGAEDESAGGFSDTGSGGPGRMGRAPAGASGGDLDDDIPF